MDSVKRLIRFSVLSGNKKEMSEILAVLVSIILLEIDHIIPIAKGGQTVEDNLQTLCWKCNRAKSDKIIA